MRRARSLVAVLLAALALGVAAQLGDLLPGVPHSATALGAPWLLAVGWRGA